MNDLRTAAQQALEALKNNAGEMRVEGAISILETALAQQDEPVATVAKNATTQQCVVETPPSDYRRGYWDGFNIGKREGRIEAEDALAQQAEPDGSVCARCGALAFDPLVKQQAEPVEPVAWMRPDNRVAEESYSRTQFSRGRDKPPIGTWTPLYPAPPQRKPVAWRSAEQYSPDVGSWFEYYDEFRSVSHTDGLTPLYTAPPQRQPLTEEEILKAIGWERAEMYMKLATNFPVDEAKQETLKNARAVEKASWEKNHG